MRPDKRFRQPRPRVDGWRRASARPWDVDPAPVDPAAFDGPVIPLHGATARLEPELAALSAELSIAGSRARASGVGALQGAPAPDFAAALRERLLAGLPSPAPVAGVAPAAALTAGGVAGTAVRVRPARPAFASLFDQLAAPRWTALAAAAVIVFAAIGLTDQRATPVVPQAHVATASGAILHHDGSDTTAAAGATIEPGDVLSVGAGGDAVVVFGNSEARLASGASIQLDRLDGSGIQLVQLAGRAYHRVDVPPGTAYTVRTASVIWTAHGTAFDVDREVLPDGREQVAVLAVEHTLTMAGPDLTGSLAEGRRAVVRLGGEIPDVAIGDGDAGSLVDPWLLGNGRRDRAEGRPLGILGTVDLGEPETTPSPFGSDEPTRPVEAPSATPPASTEPGPDATATPTPRPTPKPTPKPEPTPTPTPKPTPKPTPDTTTDPTPEPTPAPLSLSAFACDGGVLLDWSAYAGDGFAKLVTLRSASESIPAAWPPGDGAVVVSSASTTSATKTDGFQSTGDGGAVSFFRTLVLGSSNQVLAASPVRSVTTHATESLGDLSATPAAGGMTLGWTAFGGPGDCFTTYKAVWSQTSTNPSYLGDRDGAVAVPGQGSTGVTLDGFTSGQTVHVRVQAIRITSVGAFIVAQTGVSDVTIP